MKEPKERKKTEWPEGFLSGTMGDGSVRFRPLGKFFVNEILPRKFVPSVRTIQSVSTQKFCTPKEVQRFFFFYLLFSSDIPFIEDLQKIIIT